MSGATALIHRPGADMVGTKDMGRGQQNVSSVRYLLV